MLLALSPIKLVAVYSKGTYGVRAEAFGLGLACESPSREDALRGLLELVRARAKAYPREIVERAALGVTAEEVSVNLEDHPHWAPQRGELENYMDSMGPFTDAFAPDHEEIADQAERRETRIREALRRISALAHGEEPNAKDKIARIATATLRDEFGESDDEGRDKAIDFSDKMIEF